MSDTELVPLPQAAALMGMSERTLRRRCKAGTVAAQLVPNPAGGTAWMVERAAIDAATTQPGAASAVIAATDAATLKRLENDVQQIKSFVAGQLTTREALRDEVSAALDASLSPLLARLEALATENAELRAQKSAAPWWRRFFSDP
jgi:uncharacterized protein (UPF0210 family)